MTAPANQFETDGAVPGAEVFLAEPLADAAGAPAQEGDSPAFTQPQVRDPDRFTGHGVRLRLFEGPLDLLLYLIRAHRYDIFDIPLLEVTNQFLEYLRLMDEVELEYAGDFLVTAATLMQIKSRMLLPQRESENEEEIENKDDDPRTQLVQRLLEYQRLQGAAETLKEMREEREQMFTRPPLEKNAPRPDEEGEEPEVLHLQEVSSFDLLRALQKVLDRMAEKPVALIHREPFTVGERMRHLLDRVRNGGDGLTFSELCEDCQSRLEVVVSFLALLELIRRGRVAVSQRQLFDEIWVGQV